VKTFVVYPEIKEKATVVVLIHEIFGLTDWVQLMSDQLAGQGFIVMAPDLLSGMGPNGGRTVDIPSSEVREYIQKLPPDQIKLDLDAVVAYGRSLPAANGKVAVGGFCWGGTQTFLYATKQKDIAAGLVFYGSPPEAEAMKNISAPIYGFYAENDARINATLPDTEKNMKAAGKVFEPVIYTGAGHGFMRAGQAPEAQEANKKGFEDGFKRLVEILKKL
jgi:carboxymethylenebutenolidase